MGIVHSGKRNPNWRGGRTVASNGYVLLRRPNHPMADVRGYIYEHRLVASEMLGRILDKSEIVHHKNENKQDNRPENLEVLSSISEHRNEHQIRTDKRKFGESNPLIFCACGCGSEFEKYDRSNRPRKFVSGHNVGKR